MQKSESKLRVIFGSISIIIGILNLYLGFYMFYEVPHTLYLFMPIFHHTISQITFGLVEVLAGIFLIINNINALTIFVGLAIMLITNSIFSNVFDGIEEYNLIRPIINLTIAISILILIQIFKNKVSLATEQGQISRKFIYIIAIAIGSGIPIILHNVTW